MSRGPRLRDEDRDDDADLDGPGEDDLYPHERRQADRWSEDDDEDDAPPAPSARGWLALVLVGLLLLTGSGLALFLRG